MRTRLGYAGAGRGQGGRDALGAVTTPAALSSTSSHRGVGLQGVVRLAHFGGQVTLGAEWRGVRVAASAIPQVLRTFESLSALQPQPALFSRLQFGNPLTTSPCSHHSTWCSCVHAVCSQASLPTLIRAGPSASAGGKAAGEGGCGKESQWARNLGRMLSPALQNGLHSSAMGGEGAVAHPHPSHRCPVSTSWDFQGAKAPGTHAMGRFRGCPRTSLAHHCSPELVHSSFVAPSAHGLVATWEGADT